MKQRSTMRRVPINHYTHEVIKETAQLTSASYFVFGATCASITLKNHFQTYPLWGIPPCLKPSNAAAKIREFVLYQIVTCTHPKDIPDLEERWERGYGLRYRAVFRGCYSCWY